MRDIIVCGLGDSLLRLLPDLPDYWTIGVNDVCRHFEPDYTIVLDRPGSFKNGRRAVIETTCSKVWAFNPVPWEFQNAESVTKFEYCRFEHVESADQYIKYCKDGTFPKLISSPFSAVALAVHLGATKIGLVGVDCDIRFHHMGRRLDKLDLGFGQLRGFLRRHDIELVNLGKPESKLERLPAKGLDYMRKKDGTRS